MNLKCVTSTEFKHKAGQWIDEAGKAPVVITKHSRPARVLIDIEEYERLKSFEDTRKSVYPHELSDELKEALSEGYQGEPPRN